MSSGPSLSIVTAAERPELVVRAWTATRDALPQYNNHGTVLNRYWDRLVGERPEFQLHLVEGDEPVARVRAVPVRWPARSPISRPGSTARSRVASTSPAPTPSALC